MKRKETYLSRDLRETAALRFPAQAKELNTAFDMRLSALQAENADAFEARGVDEVKQEAAHKEVSKVREDKAR